MWYSGSDGLYRIGYATSPDGISWTRFAGNPVLNAGTAGSWDDWGVTYPSVIFDGATYHMWFAGTDGVTTRIGYATSPDGTTWTKNAANPVLNLGLAGSWDDGFVYTPKVLKIGATYHMYYTGNDGTTYRIGHATSTNGVVWTKNPANPVLSEGPPGSWDDTLVAAGAVLYDGATYQMWYGGSSGTDRKVGRATSPDGVTWTKNPYIPIFESGPPGSWEDVAVGVPIVQFNGTIYKMWYEGHDGSYIRTGYATSPDGLTWTKKPSQYVLDIGAPGSWEETDVSSPFVIYDGVTYKMWYNGQNNPGQNRIGYATSPDGITWTKDPSNPVLDLGGVGAWDNFLVYCPTVIFDGSSYQMWFGGSDGTTAKIGYATSPDGIIWNKYPGNPVLDLGSSGSWDDADVSFPNVVYDGGSYHMWYTGFDGIRGRIGYATSPDGIIWTKSASNPVLDIGPAGSWDENGILDSMVIKEKTTFRMWFSGANNMIEEQIGYAVSQDGTNWKKSESNPVQHLGMPGTWESDWVVYPTVIPFGAGYKMWFTGKDAGDNRKIGYAGFHHWRTGNFTSSVFDSGANGTIWNSINWTKSLPSGTNITIATRSGDTPTPDASWSTWSAEIWNETGSTIASPASRYIQYRATFLTADRDATPILSHVNINYTLADTNPPTITDLLEDPNPQEVFGSVNITAKITDDTAVDEVWINISGEGNFSMFFDSISGLYYYEASYSTLAIFSYTIWANDTLDKWASASSSFVIHDTTPPAIANMLENPDPQEVYGSVNISANVTDNYALDEVWINISGHGNFSMIFDLISGLYYYEDSYSNLGVQSFTIWSNDTSDNWASASSAFAIQDSTSPVISNLVEDPDPQYINDDIGISATIIDNLDIDEVWINIEEFGNFSMTPVSGTDEYFYDRSFQNPGTYTYTIWAKDNSDNWNSASSSFTIIELDDEEPVYDWWWVLLVIIIIILIIIILFLLMKRRKKEEEEEPAQPQSQLPPPPPPPPNQTQSPPYQAEAEVI
jgi:predicted GH43/DUF377 family glycosyl hydrolase